MSDEERAPGQIKDDLYTMITESAKKLLDAVDIMNNGPDDSDVELARARLNESVELAMKWKKLYTDTYGTAP